MSKTVDAGKATAGLSKMKDGRDEVVVDPDLVIVDAHHHLYIRPQVTYLLDDYREDARLGHRIAATVYIETQSMARPDGPEALRPVGEIEFANGMAAMCASGAYGDCRVAAAIVGYADMTTGDHVAETLDRSLAAAPDRFRGIRQIAMSHPDPSVLRFLGHHPPPDLLKSAKFRIAFAELAKRGLTFDAAVMHHQLPEVEALAAAFPDTPIILNHMGLATAVDMDESGRAEVFRHWRDNLRSLARQPNVTCKIGGLGTVYWGFGFNLRPGPVDSLELASAWRPYVETAIEAFGARRCMMESNFPNDGRSCGFVPVWNALKSIVRGASPEEKAALFHGTAASTYRIDLPALASA
jgi:L-fuconolactonase